MRRLSAGDVGAGSALAVSRERNICRICIFRKKKDRQLDKKNGMANTESGIFGKRYNIRIEKRGKRRKR